MILIFQYIWSKGLHSVHGFNCHTTNIIILEAMSDTKILDTHFEYTLTISEQLLKT